MTTDDAVDAIDPAHPGHPAENATLRKLRAELGDDAAVDHFVTDFLELLDERLAVLQALLLARRIEDTVTALLTIETSGLMVGAQDLARAATRLRVVVAEQQAVPYAPYLAAVVEAAERAKHELAG